MAGARSRSSRWNASTIRWRWHVGLDVDSTAILNALYRGEGVAAEDLERMVLLLRLEFRDPADAWRKWRGAPCTWDSPAGPIARSR